MADLSNNVIEEVQDNYNKNRFKLDKLLLRENQIQVLGKSAFKNFQWLNYTSLEGNPTYAIGKDDLIVLIQIYIKLDGGS